VVPFKEARTITVDSLLPSPVSFEVSDPSIVTIDEKSKPGSILVTGISIGDTIITARCEDYVAQAQVSVRKYAAVASPGVTRAIVTGFNAPGSLVARAAKEAGRRTVVLEPGARINSISMPSAARELPPGKAFQIPVHVEASGPYYLPAKISAQVVVENLFLAQVPTSWLMYSNDPESLLKYQTLFAGRIYSHEESYRLLYHHQNMMSKRVGFVVDILNAASSPASFHLTEGISEPIADPVLVGYKAGLEFMENFQSKVGRIIEIPAGQRWVLVSQSLGHADTASGILEFHQLSGDPLIVRVAVKPDEQRASDDPPGVPLPAIQINASRIALSDHVYPNPVKNLNVTYTVGKPWVFLRIGKYAIKHTTQDKQLYGNYGVTYDIKATLENPMPSPHTVELAYEATAGPVSGLFIVDGNMVRIKCLQPPSEAMIGKVTIPAGRTRTISILTMPLSGSAYPATIIIRPTGTAASFSAMK
jgi:hypothetical protein